MLTLRRLLRFDHQRSLDPARRLRHMFRSSRDDSDLPVDLCNASARAHCRIGRRLRFPANRSTHADPPHADPLESKHVLVSPASTIFPGRYFNCGEAFVWHADTVFGQGFQTVAAAKLSSVKIFTDKYYAEILPVFVGRRPVFSIERSGSWGNCFGDRAGCGLLRKPWTSLTGHN